MIKVTKDTVAETLGTLKHMAEKRVLIGIPSDKTPRRGEPINNAALGFIHENGSAARNIPPRPFLIPGVRDAASRCVEVLKRYGKAAFGEPTQIDKGLNASGLIAQASVKNRIVSQEGFTPLKASTIAARKSRGAKGEKALIRTGQLLNSISYVVRGK